MPSKWKSYSLFSRAHSNPTQRYIISRWESSPHDIRMLAVKNAWGQSVLEYLKISVHHLHSHFTKTKASHLIRRSRNDSLFQLMSHVGIGLMTRGYICYVGIGFLILTQCELFSVIRNIRIPFPTSLNSSHFLLIYECMKTRADAVRCRRLFSQKRELHFLTFECRIHHRIMVIIGLTHRTDDQESGLSFLIFCFADDQITARCVACIHTYK